MLKFKNNKQKLKEKLYDTIETYEMICTLEALTEVITEMYSAIIENEKERTEQR